MNENTKPIEPEDYLVQRNLLYKVVSEPLFAKTLDNETTNFFPANQPLYDIYTSAMTIYRMNHFQTAVDRNTLRIKVAEKLDAMNPSVETRGQYDYVMNDVYTTEEEHGKISMDTNSIIMDHIRVLSTTDAMKRAIAQDLTPTAIAKLLKEMHRIEANTISTVVPESINVLSADTIEEQARKIKELLTSRIPTPYHAYNLATGNGLAKGEMGCIGAKSGNGKTLHMSSLAIGYVMSGMDVVYFALEELEARMYHRLFKSVIDRLIREENSLNSEQIDDLVDLRNAPAIMESGMYAEIIETLKNQYNIKIGNLHLMKYKPYELTVAGLHLALNTLTVTKGIHLDVMFIDYPDLMDYDKSDGESESGGRLYAEIRGISQHFSLITWVATQLNRSTNGAELYTESHLEGSFRKQNALECLVIINQTQEEYENGFTRIYISKARNSTYKGECIQLTVNKQTATLRDQSPLEASRHATLLNSAGGSSKADASPQDTTERAEAMRSRIQGGEIKSQPKHI